MRTLTEWLFEQWAVEKEEGSPDYVVGLGSGVLRDEDGKLTLAGENVVDKCHALFNLHTRAQGIILIGGKPWKRPPVTDVELMHQRLLRRGQSTGEPGLLQGKVIILNGNNTHEQICALRRFLSECPPVTVILVCPGMQSRRVRAILRKQGLLKIAGIATVEDGCEPYLPVEKFRWSKGRYFIREILAYTHHRCRGWI